MPTVAYTPRYCITSDIMAGRGLNPESRASKIQLELMIMHHSGLLRPTLTLAPPISSNFPGVSAGPTRTCVCCAAIRTRLGSCAAARGPRRCARGGSGRRNSAAWRRGGVCEPDCGGGGDGRQLAAAPSLAGGALLRCRRLLRPQGFILRLGNTAQGNGAWVWAWT